METNPRMHLRRQLEDHLEALPSLPTAVAQLMMLDRDDPHYFDKLLGILESEPNLSIRVLSRANSAVAGAQSQVTTLRAALGRIGSQAASNLVLSMAMTNVFIPRDEGEKSLWRHAIQVATAARELALGCNDPELNPDEAYTAGLLHDIGRFIMFQEAPEKLKQLGDCGWTEPAELLEQELAICGVTHSELGAIACRRWHIPELISECVKHHHTPLAGLPAGKLAKLITLIQIADLAMFPSALPGTPPLEEASDDVLQKTLLKRMPPYLQLSMADWRALLRRVREQAEASARSLGVG